MKREYLILEGDQMSADDWTDEINSTICPEYWWLNQWKPASVVVHLQRHGRVNLLVLERFIVGLGVGCVIEKHHGVRFRDCRKRSPQMKAVFEFFCGHYTDVTQPKLNGDQVTETGTAARSTLAAEAKARKRLAAAEKKLMGGKS